MNTRQTQLSGPETQAGLVRGKQDYWSVVWRLTVTELLVMRRHRLSKILIGIAIGAVLAFVLVRTVRAWAVIHAPLAEFVPLFCSDQYTIPGCVTHLPTYTDLEAYKRLSIGQTIAHLSLPLSLNNISGTLIGQFLYMGVVIAVGVMLGSDYSQRTIRLMYTRGPTRLQFLWAKMLAASIGIVPAFLFLNGLGLALAQTSYLVLGFWPDWGFLTMTWFWHAGLYLLTGLLIWFVNALMAFFFGALGRSTAFAIVATLMWWAVEFAVIQIISAFTDPKAVSPDLGVKALSTYLLWSNLYALHDNLAHVVYGGASGSVSNLHAVCVLGIFMGLFVGLAGWFTVKRDIIE
jgi:ABC-type transport system involved in multi-copper enzyme maturation permease subunit